VSLQPHDVYWLRAHRDWRFYAVVLLMLGAISTYVFTMDLSWRPRRQAALVVLAEPAAR
jgi:hypothetical protein